MNASLTGRIEEHLKAPRGLAGVDGPVVGADAGSGIEREHVGGGHPDHWSARPLTAQTGLRPWR
eukprot:6786893-Alexandrium_andersonii.AAC.1